MLAEIVLAITSFLTGKAISKPTVKEIKKYNKIVRNTPLIISLLISAVILSNYLEGVILVIVGALLSLAFRKNKDQAPIVFATITLLVTTVNAEIGFASALLFIIYFITKGSLDHQKPVNGSIMILIGTAAFLVLNFVKLIDSQLSLIFSSLFIGAVVGGELAIATKNKSKN